MSGESQPGETSPLQAPTAETSASPTESPAIFYFDIILCIFLVLVFPLTSILFLLNEVVAEINVLTLAAGGFIVLSLIAVFGTIVVENCNGRFTRPEAETNERFVLKGTVSSASSFYGLRGSKFFLLISALLAFTISEAILDDLTVIGFCYKGLSHKGVIQKLLMTKLAFQCLLPLTGLFPSRPSERDTILLSHFGPEKARARFSQMVHDLSSKVYPIVYFSLAMSLWITLSLETELKVGTKWIVLIFGFCASVPFLSFQFIRCCRVNCTVFKTCFQDEGCQLTSIFCELTVFLFMYLEQLLLSTVLPIPNTCFSPK